MTARERAMRSAVAVATAVLDREDQRDGTGKATAVIEEIRQLFTRHTAGPVAGAMTQAELTAVAVQVGAEAAGLEVGELWSRVIERAVQAMRERDARDGTT